MKHRDRETSSGASIIPNYSFDDGWGGEGGAVSSRSWTWPKNKSPDVSLEKQ